MEDGTDKSERARLALAWERLEERKRVLKQIPLPRSIDVSKLAKRGSRKATAPVEEPAEPGVVTPPAA